MTYFKQERQGCLKGSSKGRDAVRRFFLINFSEGDFIMKNKTLRLAIAQINTTVGDLEANTAKIIERIALAQKKECDIVVFPELAVTGYPPEDLLLKPQFIRDNIASLKKVAWHTGDIVAVVGFVDCQGKAIFNAAALTYNKKIWGVYRKMLLPNYGVFDEKRYFQPGTSYLIAKIDNVSFGVTICEDIWDVSLVDRVSMAGANLIIAINASPFHMGKMGLRKSLLLGHARKDAIFIAYNNLVGGQDELVFDGRSMVVDKQGLIMQALPFQEDMVVVDLDMRLLQKAAPIKKKGISVTFVEIPKKITSKQAGPKPAGPMPGLSIVEEVYLALILGLRDYVKKNDFRKVVIGLSGGIDSALTVAIATVSLGKENVKVVFMPSQFSSGESKNYSQQLASNLGVKLEEIPIQGIFESFKEVLRSTFKGLKKDITEENLQARIRGMILMALSNKFGWLVVTTGNKSEMSTGYATLYGDMAGGFALLKDVPKTLVFELARYFNLQQGKEVIPTKIIERAPTAELRPNQKDSDSLPDYAILDKIIKFYVEENKSPGEIVSQGIDRDIVKEVIDLIDKAEYKRRQSPPGIKITPRAFGKDRRMPITNRYKG